MTVENLLRSTSLSPPFDKPMVVTGFYNLALKMKKRLADYDSILSDEASGRLPALVFYGLINQRRKSFGREPVKIFFICGGNGLDDQRQVNIEDFLSKRTASLGRALLITEFIFTGKSIQKLSSILTNLRIKHDITTFSHNTRMERSFRFFSGLENYDNINIFYLNYRFTGVIKRNHVKLPFPEKLVTNRQAVNNAHKSALILGRSLAEIIS